MLRFGQKRANWAIRIGADYPDGPGRAVNDHGLLRRCLSIDGWFWKENRWKSGLSFPTSQSWGLMWEKSSHSLLTGGAGNTQWPVLLSVEITKTSQVSGYLYSMETIPKVCTETPVAMCTTMFLSHNVADHEVEIPPSDSWQGNIRSLWITFLLLLLLKLYSYQDQGTLHPWAAIKADS